MRKILNVKHQTRPCSAQAGFTLVELAIVMIIIGLLIAGVLKGQALIANAQVTTTVAQLKSIDAATTTFKDTYNFIPGDLISPATVVPNCPAATACGQAGDGNGRLNNTPLVTPASTEGSAFFPQLSAANLVTGITPGTAASVVVGQNYPAAKISNNAIQPGGTAAGALADFPGTFLPAAPVAAGLYLTITQLPGAPTPGLTPDKALRIDTKMDDGVPDTGSVIASGSNGLAATNCGKTTVGTTPGQYASIATTPTCILHIHIQS